MRIFGNVGKGIKSPTFSERFGGSFADPSPDLKVERARTTDAGVETSFADQRLRATATWFDNRYRDQIEFRSSSPFFSPDGQPDYLNIAGSNAHGLELEGALDRPVHGVTAAATYTFLDTKVVETLNTGAQFQPGQPLLRRPAHSGTVRVSYVAPRVLLQWDTRFVGQRHDSAFLSLRTLTGITTDITVNPGYAVSGAGAELILHRRASIYLRADNLFDRAYESALGYPGLPRAFRVGVRVSSR
jgi:vitamin B12 transporter